MSHCCGKLVSQLTRPLHAQLEELSLTGEEHVNAWSVGIDGLPMQWSKLKRLKSLQLRGHNLIAVSTRHTSQLHHCMKFLERPPP
jgi:hypothetical protein